MKRGGRGAPTHTYHAHRVPVQAADLQGRIHVVKGLVKGLRLWGRRGQHRMVVRRGQDEEGVVERRKRRGHTQCTTCAGRPRRQLIFRAAFILSKVWSKDGICGVRDGGHGGRMWRRG